MELRPDLKDGCHESANGALPAGKQPAPCPVTGTQAVTTSKYVDCCLIATLACEIGHNSDFLTISFSDFGLSLGERISGEPDRTVVRRKVLARVPAGGVADGGFAVEGVRGS
jgi:hypothetical protein